MTVSGCGSCGLVFGSLGLFDAHQHWDRTGQWTLACVLPPGLVQDRRGTWRTTEGLAKAASAAAVLAAARSPAPCRAPGGPSPA